MCCLFGIVDYQNNLTPRQLNRITAVLSRACEARGTDATGIAYNWNDNLKIYKQPLPAHKMKYQIPFGVHTIMGHTRMTTQGDEKQNYNNHPFYGSASNTDFALAHNGVLHNDIILRATEELPDTTIETDSYIAVQLIEKKETLNTDSLKYMAEQLRVLLLLRCWTNRKISISLRAIILCVFIISKVRVFTSTLQQRRFF